MAATRHGEIEARVEEERVVTVKADKSVKCDDFSEGREGSYR